MALNLSTLTSPATSGDVLAEALTTADFLEPVPVLRNLARGSQKGGDAKQDVALNQPKALPLIDGDGYCYLSGVNGNSAETDNPVLPFSDDFDVSVDLYYTGSTGNRQTIFSQYYAGDGSRFFIYIDPSDYLSIFWGGTFYVSSTVVPEGRNTIRVTKSGNTVTTYLNGVQAGSATRLGVGIAQVNLLIGTWSSIESFKGAIFSVTEANGLLNCDFTSTNVRHGATKFKCATGQVVTINQSGNDPATIIKKPVLRFDGADDGLNGLFNQTITEGYMFAAFSVLGDGGEGGGRILGLNSTGVGDSGAGGVGFRRNGTTNGLMIRYNENNITTHNDFFDDERGDYLLEAKVQDGSQQSKVNNADADNGVGSISESLSAEEFSVGVYTNGINNNAAIDLEYLALFSADSVPDEATATQIRNYINNRNNVFDLKDGFGYYFYDAQKAPVGNISSGSASWNGRIVGSDFGDSDRYLTQGTSDDQPVGDGFKVTFADNTDHLEIPSTTQAGWQVVGTSLGTFAYRVNANAVTELNLLGNLGNATYRKAGDLYGIILLPETATGADIEAARRLLIHRGASESAAAVLNTAWRNRTDIVQFDGGDMSGVISLPNAWKHNSSLTSFHAELPSVTSTQYAWNDCTSLSEFRTTDIKNCSNFTSAWQNCSALTSFPADAKLGTSANNVNFTSAWQQSGLTSFPALDLSTGNSFHNAFNGCSALTSFPADAKLGTSAQNVNFTNTWRASGLTSFPSLDLSKGTTFHAAWYDSSITQFASGVDLNNANDVSYAWGFTPLTSFPLVQVGNVPYFLSSWQNCTLLTDFAAGVFTNWNPSSITNGVFNNTWKNCNSLTAQSVENILVSIDASGKYATSTGASGGSALADAGIDIDYDGTTLSAATNSAVTSLKSKGWSIFINSVEQ